MQFVQEYSVIDENLQMAISGYIYGDKRPFDQSMVYNSLTDEKLLVPEERHSQFKTFLCHEHKHLTTLCENYIQQINQRNKHINFMMVHNDITHIKYTEGGFFKSHEDYLSLTSNVIEEYTMIMCLDVDSDSPESTIGGETILHLNDHFQYPSRATTTKLHTLIFRKDIRHEGALIKRGRKEIMTLNLWGVKVDNDNNNRIIVVSFVKDSVVDKRTYAFNVSDVMSFGETNTLKVFVNFRDMSQGTVNAPVDKILRYEETHYTYEQYAIIAKIYKKYKIEYKEYYDNIEIIDYYGFDWQNLLVQKYHEEIIDKNKQKVDDEIACLTENEDFDDLILCGDESEYIKFLTVIKETKIQYMPFKMVLIEGTLSYGGGMSDEDPQHVKMQPVWISVSERNNMYYYQNLVTTRDVGFSLNNEERVFNYGEKFKELQNIIDENEIDLDKINEKNFLTEQESREIEQYIKFQKFADDQKVKWKPICPHEDSFGPLDDTKPDVYIATELESYNYYGHKYGLLCCSKMDIGGIIKSTIKKENGQPPNLSKSGQIGDIKERTENYVIDKYDQIAILPEHFDKVIDRINQIDLVKTVKERLDKISFHLPQVRDSYEHSFCNESVYGNFNFLTVYGFISMD